MIVKLDNLPLDKLPRLINPRGDTHAYGIGDDIIVISFCGELIAYISNSIGQLNEAITLDHELPHGLPYDFVYSFLIVGPWVVVETENHIDLWRQSGRDYTLVNSLEI